MAGGKEEKDEAPLPPNEAGREVLTYIQQQEKEADEAWAQAHGVEEEEGNGEEEEKAQKATNEEEEKGTQNTEEETVVKKEEAPQKAAGDDDLTKGLNTENASKRISAAQNKMHTSNTRAKSAEDERDKLRADNEALQAQIAAASKAAPTTTTETEKKVDKKEEAGDLEGIFDELAQEYPEIAKPMLKMMAIQTQDNKNLLSKLNVLEQKEITRETNAKMTEENSHWAAVSVVHKDFKEIAEDPLLDEWIETLPAIQKAGAKVIRKNGDTDAVIELLTDFKKANGYELPAEENKQEKKGNSKLEKAKKAANPTFKKAKDVNLKDGVVGRFTRKQIGAMSQAEYDQQEPEIDKWMQAGSPE